MSIKQPYHEGELAVQQRLNQAGMARINGGAIDDTILAGALRFIEQQAMLVIGSVDTRGQVWSSVLFGQPGFVRALDNRTVELNVTQPRSAKDDPLWENLQHNPNVGLLVIELGSRRRIRINGVVKKASAQRYIIAVEHAYPNCPKYIQRRILKIQAEQQQIESTAGTRGVVLTARQKNLISGADTFFVASAHPEHGVDISHRGGHPGFVKIINERQLRIPDFVGNSMFNTLGNFVCYPHAGLVFIDFEQHRLLQLTGVPEILWELDGAEEETGGTKRFWQFDITTWHENSLPIKINWEFMDASPHIPERQQQNKADNALQMQVERIQQETDRVKSFRLRVVDGGLLPEFQAGAHLQVKVSLPDGTESHRHYSLLNDPNEQSFYEIGVLKEPQGQGGSVYMHEQVNEGDVLEIFAPKNEFPLAANAEHSILIAGGIGITPILPMMYTLTSKGKSFELHYTARSYAGLAFRNRIENVAGTKARFYASIEVDDQGNSLRMNLRELLATAKPGVHVYICGPRGMISAARDIAVDCGWHASQIHYESFGTQSLPGDRSVRVHLASSNKTITVAAQRSILDTLLDAGINIPHDCRRGECSMCVTRVLKGTPEHRDLCLSTEEKLNSMCICVSRARGNELHLDL